MDDKVIQYVKWGICAALAVGIGYLVLPVLLKLALDLVTVVIIGVCLFGLWILLPAISEILAQLSEKIWNLAIEGGPIIRLRRDLKAHADQILDMEKHIGEATAQVLVVKDLVRQQRDKLSPEQLEEWQQQVEGLTQMIRELIDTRDNERAEHQKFSDQIDREEANYKIATAIGSGLKIFNKNKTGRNSAGSKVAIDAIHQRLAESQAKMSVVLSRKPLTYNAPVSIPTVVPQQVPQLTNTSATVTQLHGSTLKADVFNKYVK